MHIIAASEKHLAAVWQLCKDCSQNMLNNFIDQWDQLYPNKEIFLHDITSNNLYIAVANDSAEILGCIVLNESQDPEYKEVEWECEGDKIAVIHRLMVSPKYEGRGIARRLLVYAEELSRKHKYRAIRLDVFSKNPRAVSLYSKAGYVIRGKVTFRKGEFLCCEKLIPSTE